jgi:hypothetical protein
MVHTKLLITAAIIITSLVIYDLGVGKKSNPAYFTAPEYFCSQGWSGITLPPAGIFICDKDKSSSEVKNHELVHWAQYQRFGTLSYYGNYAWGWMTGGFSYRNNWMEKEAYKYTGGSAL